MNETFIVDNRAASVLSDDSLNFRGSTASLLTPLYASDYESQSGFSSILSSTSSSDSVSSEAKEDIFSGEINFNKRYTKATGLKSERPSEEIAPRRRFDPERESHRSKRANNHHKIFTKSWEEWVIEKAVEDLKKVQIKKEIKQEHRLAEKKKKEEKAAVDRKIEENRLKWLEQKNFQFEKQKNENAAEKEYKKLKKQQKQELINNKAKKAYDDWLEKKTAEKLEKVEKSKQLKLEKQKKEMEQKILNEISYQNWKRKTKLEQKQRPKTSAYQDDSNFHYYHQAISPEPSYVNPIPWKGLLDSRRNDMMPVRYKEGSSFQSPPLLWKEREERLKQKNIERRSLHISNEHRTKEKKRRNNWA